MKSTLLLSIIFFSLLSFQAFGQGSGHALSFDGNDYVTFPVNTALYNQNQVTIECWFYHDNPSGIESLFSQWNSNCGSTTKPGLMLWIWNSKALFSISHSKTISSSNAITANQWHHIAMVYDGTQAVNTDRVKIYIDGIAIALDFSSQGTVPGTTGTSSNTAFIGCRPNCGGSRLSFLTTTMDELRIWTKALTPTEIHTNMCKKLTGSEAGLVAYYRMDEGADNTCSGGEDICDLTGNNNHGIKY